ncbi:hypothetical protein VKT23_010178 [Stygiomarasmius scandens]|uniref:Uncharacterized protein n=1 Tax=Marasmiellus scandens TaxID=2682957 RepID=A0ABR1JD47_9AGAR
MVSAVIPDPAVLSVGIAAATVCVVAQANSALALVLAVVSITNFLVQEKVAAIKAKIAVPTEVVVLQEPIVFVHLTEPSVAALMGKSAQGVLNNGSICQKLTLECTKQGALHALFRLLVSVYT